MNGKVFNTYVAQVLLPALQAGVGVIIENLHAHRTACVRDAIDSVGAKLMLLLPFSTDFNPLRSIHKTERNAVGSSGAKDRCSMGSRRSLDARLRASGVRQRLYSCWICRVLNGICFRSSIKCISIKTTFSDVARDSPPLKFSLPNICV
jgi:hypothetical protein